MKCKKRLLGVAIFLCSMISFSFAQTYQVTGKVTSQRTGEGLPLATISVKGKAGATQTDASGNYSISLPAGTATLVASFTGMTNIEKNVSQAGVVNFVLVDAPSLLEDVVVVGYGTQKITKVSGAISTVKAADIERLKPTRTEEAIQGGASGVNVILNGSPGAAPTVQIRGIPSYSGTAPLVVIDGVPQTIIDLNALNPADIESINVLKDASTTAIYGVKGGNGVIVVTTKTGRKNQKTQVTLNANYGIQEVARTIGVLNATEYGAIVNEGSTVSGGPVIFSDLSKLGVGTDWQKEIFKTAPIQNYSVAMRGGSDKTTYFLSTGFLQQGGIVGGIDKSRFTRGNITANLEFNISSKLKFLLNTTGVILDGKGIQENSFNSVIGSALNFDPTVPIFDTTGSVGKYGYSNLLLSEIFNPLTKLDNTYNKNIGNKLYGKAEMQYNVWKDLRLTSRFGYTKYDGNAKSFTPLVFYGPLNVENSMDASGNPIPGRHNSVSHEKTSNFSYTWESFANYDFDIASKHHFETVLGISIAKSSGNAAGASRQDVPFNSWDFADFTAATGNNTGANTNALTGYYYQYFRKNISYFSRVNYDYSDKYLASVIVRRDGSYAFGKNNKFANFVSGSLGWVVSKEDFFESKLINYLKIRGSYGTVGNENVDPAFVSIVTGGPSYGPTGNSNGYTFGDIFYPGSTVGSAANESLRWEEQKQFNAGFDVTLLNNKVSISADYYEKRVQGQLFTPTVSLYVGTVPAPAANIGSTKSSGVDINVSYNEKVGKFWKISNNLTFTTSTNLVTATNSDGTAKLFGGYYFNGQSQSVTVYEKGFSPGYFFGYKTMGLFQNASEIAAAPTQLGAQPGDIRYVDVNGDGAITSEDQTQIGDPFPDFNMGWTLNVSYKNFDFSAFTYASVGNDVYRAYERNANFSNKFRSVLARWTGEGTTNDARYPRYSFTDGNNNNRVSDRFVEDGSFIRVKNIQLGYSIPNSVTKNIFKGLRIYAQVKNAFTLTDYTGFDPEISGGILDSGIDRGAYPQSRTYAVGLDIKL